MATDTPVRWLLATLAALCLCAAGCDSDPEPELGNAGFACYFSNQCASPLTCELTAESEFNVCTGTAGEGEVCGDAVGCRWERQDGLPLECVDRLCTFPTRFGSEASQADGQ